MSAVANPTELSALVEAAESAVISIQDESLKKIAFEKVLESLLARSGGKENQTPQKSEKPANGSAPPSATTQKKYQPTAAPSIVRDLNLRPQGNPSLRDFFAEKQPRSNQEMVTVVVYYMQHIVGTSGINPDHIYTCYKEVGQKIPSALIQLLRDTSSRKGWLKTSDIADIKTEIHGENLVEHDLPRQATNKPR